MSEAPLRHRPGIGQSLAWSLTWAVGIALGVAMGGWLTLVGGAGAPGAEGLDPVSDLVVLPGIAFSVMLIAQVSVRLALRALRERARSRGEQDDHE